MAVPLQEKIRIILTLLKSPDELSALLSLKHSGYLQEWGWFNAFRKKASVGQNNEALPWVTYPFISFIRPRLKDTFNVFEYGSGNSTLFYAKFVNKITAVEHAEEWYEKMSSLLTGNAEIIFSSESGDYAGSIKNKSLKYEIVIVDGIERINCLIAANDHLTSDGVIILDDSEREEYAAGKEFLREQEFKSIDFWGIAPGYLVNKCTTVFYKSVNCLGI
jgi:hypothetical protein